MGKQTILVLLALLGFGSSVAHSNQTQAQSMSSVPKIVLESIHIFRHPIDTVTPTLFIRVWSDKRVEYQKNDSANTLATANISDEQLASLRQRLDAIDARKIKEQMGAYNTHEDSSIEMHIRFAARGADLSFSIINPFPDGVPSPSLRKGKRLPKNIKDLICECYKLRTVVAHEPINPFCDSKQDPNKKQD
jgi:hypothetical protein